MNGVDAAIAWPDEIYGVLKDADVSGELSLRSLTAHLSDASRELPLDSVHGGDGHRMNLLWSVWIWEGPAFHRR